jgi:hypothetical protein
MRSSLCVSVSAAFGSVCAATILWAASRVVEARWTTWVNFWVMLNAVCLFQASLTNVLARRDERRQAVLRSLDSRSASA